MPRLLDDFSPAQGRSDLIVRDGLVVDNLAKAMVSPIGPLRPGVFAVTEHAHTLGFREQFKKRGQLYVVVEHPDNLPNRPVKPQYVKVKEIDFKTFVLEEKLNFTPRPGSCVSLLLGVENTLIDARELERMEKQNIIWV